MAVAIFDELRDRGGIDSTSLAERFVRRYYLDPARGYGRGAHEVLATMAVS